MKDFFTTDTVRVLLTIVAMLFVAAVLAMWGLGKLDQTQSAVAMLILGAIMSKYNTVYDFYFGSSDGSKKKTEALIDKGP